MTALFENTADDMGFALRLFHCTSQLCRAAHKLNIGVYILHFALPEASSIVVRSCLLRLCRPDDRRYGIICDFIFFEPD